MPPIMPPHFLTKKGFEFVLRRNKSARRAVFWQQLNPTAEVPVQGYLWLRAASLAAFFLSYSSLPEAVPPVPGRGGSPGSRPSA